MLLLSHKISYSEPDFINHPDVINYIEKSGGPKVAIYSLLQAEEILGIQRTELKKNSSWIDFSSKKQLMRNKKDRKKVRKILFCLIKHFIQNPPKDIDLDKITSQEKK